ncbi:MAG: NAD-dependent succinate-semialdehyde dehydrogenase [Proteobacteria bacterium]|nr:NAD-dependent succinate-semialdehyde dehydrogenase [Pseudomonadota bacterium]HQR04270.1 NAD-dependent succinate-semialdehyde dehydrogenase [Rhodocyclaceae bacterium]
MAVELCDPDLLRQQAYIDGQWVDARDGTRCIVRDPASGVPLGGVPDLGPEETGQAIAAAARALPAWRALTGKARGAYLRKWFELVISRQEDLARILTAEQGKPLAEARGEITYGAAFLEWFAEEAKRVYGETIPATVPGRRLMVIRQPVGVCGAITPWNFPSAMLTRKLGPALAAGCTMVLKPSELTPFSALALTVLAERAGIPPGVINIVTSNDAAAVGQTLCASPTVRKLSFTGSTRVGKILLSQSSGTVKKVSLELGGNAPFIVFDDADLELAVKGAIASKYRNSGQTCVCSNRFLVQSGIYEEFARRFAAAVGELKVGPGDSRGSQIGPLINAGALAKVEAHVADAIGQGGRLLAGGKRHALGDNFFEPTVIADAIPAMRVAREETFGPVAPLFRFEDEAEAIRMANDTEYGLAAYFYSQDVNRVFRVAEALEYGMVGINEGVMSTEVAPFGGVKESGLGREGSRHGIDDYLEMKYLCLGGMER